MGSPGADLTVTVTGHNGFTGNVNVSVTGIPAGVSASSTSFSVAAGQSQKVTFTANANALVADFQASISGSSGSLSASTNLFSKVVLPLDSGVIGPGGGNISITDSSDPLFGVSLQVPAGALSQNVLISISEDQSAPMIPRAGYQGMTVAFAPDGLQFQAPATLNLPYPDANNDGVVDGTSVKEQFLQTRILNQQLGAYVYVPSSVDSLRKHVVLQVQHFTAWRIFAFHFPPNTVVSYRIDNMPTTRGVNATDDAVRNAVKSAFDIWRRQLDGAGITFVEESTNSNPDIRLIWDSSLLQTVLSFVGSLFRLEEFGVTLQPFNIGEIRVLLNDTVRWSVSENDNQATVNVEAVVAHEIGHALGLEHLGLDGNFCFSCAQPPLMAATGAPYDPMACVAGQDIHALWKLYDISNPLPGQSPSVPCLYRPTPNGSITQNDATIGCPADTTGSHGFGFSIPFKWGDSYPFPPNFVSYQFQLFKPNAVNPTVDQNVVASSQYSLTACNNVIADTELTGWKWQARAKDTQGVLSAWSMPRDLQFKACVLTGGSSCSTAAPVPVITAASGGEVEAGSPGIRLFVTGTGFVLDSVVQWNGSDRPTTFNSSTSLTAMISAADLAVPGFFTITVKNPPPGGISNSRLFVVFDSIPVISSISPTSAAAGSAAFTLTVSGSKFKNGAAVQWNALNRPTAFVSDTQLQASIFASDIAKSGSALVMVTNPLPFGGFSNSRTFTITSSTGGAPSFSTRSVAALWGVAGSISAGQLNGDGKLDLAVAEFSANATNQLYLGLGDGSGGFGIQSASGILANQTVISDFNGDGRSDLVLTSPPILRGLSLFEVFAFRGDGQGGFSESFSYAYSLGSRCNELGVNSIAKGDFNKDGKLDFVVGHTGFSIFLGNGDGTFVHPSNGDFDCQGAFNSEADSITVGDFNGDGNPDLAVADTVRSRVTLWLGNGKGNFQPLSPISGQFGGSLGSADFDRDGKLDLAVSGPQGTVLVYFGNGDGTFDAPLILSTLSMDRTSFAGFLVVGDFNGDNIVDMAVNGPADPVNFLGLGTMLEVLVNNGARGFAPFLITNFVDGAGPMAAGDFNNDGKSDLAVTSSFELRILLRQ